MINDYELKDVKTDAEFTCDDCMFSLGRSGRVTNCALDDRLNYKTIRTYRCSSELNSVIQMFHKITGERIL